MFLDRYAAESGLRVALGLVNDVVLQPSAPADVAVPALLAFDPTSVQDWRASHAEGFARLAQQLSEVIVALAERRIDLAASLLNDLLLAVPASQYLEKEDGEWRLHHHPRGADLVEAWTSICAESIARLVGDGYPDRLHQCAAPDCRRAYLDTTKNATRQYCSERCQNRMKAAALRRRRAQDRSS